MGHAPPYLCVKRTVKEENRVRMRKRLPIKCIVFFLEVPDISLLFPAALKYDKLIILLQT